MLTQSYVSVTNHPVFFVEKNTGLTDSLNRQILFGL